MAGARVVGWGRPHVVIIPIMSQDVRDKLYKDFVPTLAAEVAIWPAFQVVVVSLLLTPLHPPCCCRRSTFSRCLWITSCLLSTRRLCWRAHSCAGALFFWCVLNGVHYTTARARAQDDWVAVALAAAKRLHGSAVRGARCVAVIIADTTMCKTQVADDSGGKSPVAPP